MTACTARKLRSPSNDSCHNNRVQRSGVQMSRQSKATESADIQGYVFVAVILNFIHEDCFKQGFCACGPPCFTAHGTAGGASPVEQPCSGHPESQGTPSDSAPGTPSALCGPLCLPHLPLQRYICMCVSYPQLWKPGTHERSLERYMKAGGTNGGFTGT